MNFRDELARKVIAGEKTVTRRLVSDNPRSPWWREKCGYRVERVVAICPGRGKHAIGRARIVSVERMALGCLTTTEALAEGFLPTLSGTTVYEFEAAWVSINGTYDAAALVWRIGLEAIR